MGGMGNRRMNQEVVVAVVDNHEIMNLRDGVLENLQHSEAMNTKKAYASDWKDFLAWCEIHGAQALPAHPQCLASYITDRASTHRPSSLQRRLATIAVAHRAKGFTSPASDLFVRKVMRGIKNRFGTAKDKKSPVRVADLRRVNEILPNNLKGKRDLAILLVGFFGGMRRSELVGLDLSDIRFVDQGVRVTVRRSKTDQQGEGHIKDISFASHPGLCPVTALKRWIESASINEGPLFRPITRHGKMSAERLSGKAVASVVKEVAEALKLDPAAFAGHSLRAGFVTDALKAGVPTPVIRRVTGHKSDAMLSEYLREAELFGYNLTAALGL